MKIFETILIILLVLIAVVGLVILSNNYLYCSIFCKEERKTWKFVIDNIDKFTLAYSDEVGKWFEWEDYVVILWTHYGCSVHLDSKPVCLAGGYDKVMVKKVTKLLKDKFNIQ